MTTWPREAGVRLAEHIMVEWSVSIDQTLVWEHTGNWSQWGFCHCSIEALWGWVPAGWAFVWFPLHPPKSHEPCAFTAPYGPPQWSFDKVFSHRCWMKGETMCRTIASISLVDFKIVQIQQLVKTTFPHFISYNETSRSNNMAHVFFLHWRCLQILIAAFVN